MVALPQPISHTVEAVYAALVRQGGFGDSVGLSVSDAANDCERAAWYRLRWSSPREREDGLKLRRLASAGRANKQVVEDLENAGMHVEQYHPVSGEPIFIRLAGGWLRGKVDARVDGVPEAPKSIHALVCKFHNEASFKDLLKHRPPKGEGIKNAKADHFAKCQIDMHAEGLERCLYLAVNKNTDELYAERVEYDATYGLKMEAKVARLVRADRAPVRLFETPASKAAFACGWCSARAQCHEGVFARTNCRTCLSAEFRDGAEVWCGLLDVLLTYDEQQAGCQRHLFLPDLVPGDQIDASEEARTVTYKLTDGSIWVDGAAAKGRAV